MSLQHLTWGFGGLVRNHLTNLLRVGSVEGTADPTVPSLPLETAVTTSKSIAADTGSYTITGTAAGTLKGWRVAATGGSYTVTGTAASLERGFKTTALAGSYAVTGTAASLEFGRKVGAGAGSYAVTGTNATLTKSGTAKTLTADAGSYAVTGTAATLRHNVLTIAGTGSYSVTGTNATLTKAGNKSIAADSGSYAITGTDATLSKTTVPSATQPQAPRYGGGGAPIWPGALEHLFRKKKPKKAEIVAEVAEVVAEAVPQVTVDESQIVAARLVAQMTIVQLQQIQSLDALIERVEAELAELDDEEVLLLAA
jgi:hypothetical protein